METACYPTNAALPLRDARVLCPIAKCADDAGSDGGRCATLIRSGLLPAINHPLKLMENW